MAVHFELLFLLLAHLESSYSLNEGSAEDMGKRFGCFMIIKFSLNVFTEFAEFSDKNICHDSKRAQTCHSAPLV